MESLEKYAVEKGEVTDSLSSGRQEYLESVLNQYWVFEIFCQACLSHPYPLSFGGNGF